MHILIVRNNSNPQAIDSSLLLMSYLNSMGVSTSMVDSSDLGNDRQRATIRQQLAEPVNLAIVLGGDGTVLHTVHLLEEQCPPILPINFGRMGFLTNSDEKGIIPLSASALAGELHEDRRSMLSVEVICEDVPASDGEEEMPSEEFGVNCSGLEGTRRFTALNEAALTRGAMGRIIEFSLQINGTNVFKERGDGLVVATATGSTAYALSSGGPLVSPQHNGLVAVPIAPHTLRARAIVTEPSDVLEVRQDDQEAFRDATLFIDGELMVFPTPVRRLILKRADDAITLLRPGADNFYEAIAQKFFR